MPDASHVRSISSNLDTKFNAYDSLLHTSIGLFKAGGKLYSPMNAISDLVVHGVGPM